MSNLKENYMDSKYTVLKVFSARDGKETSLVENAVNGRIFIRKRVPAEQGRIYQYLMTLRHPGLVPVVEVVPGERQYTVIEEYAAGITLDEYVKSYGCRTEKQAANYMIQLCNVLQLLHGHNIVHRDITPNNIIVTLDGYVKLIDFDIARIRKPDRVQDTTILGTVGFAAPEQFGFTQTDSRTDIYALGVVLNYMLTGKLPGECKYQTQPFSQIIEKATALDPAGRFSDVGQIAAILMAGRAVTAKVGAAKPAASRTAPAKTAPAKSGTVKPVPAKSGAAHLPDLPDSTEHMSSVAAAAGQMSQEAVSGAEVERKEDGRKNHLKISRKEAFRAMMANRRLERKKRMEAYAIKPDTPKAVRFFKSIPGFRTGLTWKMAVAVLGYLFTLVWGYSMAASFAELHYPFLLCVLLFFMEVILPFVLFTNLGHIDRKVPGIRELEAWPARWIRIGLGSLIIVLATIIGQLYTGLQGK